jgi:fused signal recognition particle receptor
MSDAPGQKKGWFARLAEGLTRSSRQMTEQVVSVLTKMQLDDAALATLEDLLIESDLGPEASERIVKRFGAERFGERDTSEQIKGVLARAIAEELAGHVGRFDPLGGPRPYVVLFVGVNGSGKTTTLGKIAADLKRQGAEVVVGAADTFRAAAIEQLQVWGQRAGVPVVAKAQGTDPAGVAYEALERAQSEGADVVLIDTAGRLQNKTQLMDELAKIVRVLKKLDPTAPHETLLVLDATVGRNALSQIEVFDRTANVTGVVMTKLDGTARGGVLVPVAQASEAPIKLIGVGEGLDDLQPFDAQAFSRGLVGLNPA